MSESPSPVRLAVVLSVLVTASAASIMSTDLYVPSLPSLRGYFATTEQAVQLTVTLNLLAFGLAQLWHGPLSDRFGRRPVMLVGLAVFVLASAACALAQTVEQLIAARIVQGFAAAVEAVVGLAVVRDLFDGHQRVRAYAIWGIAVAAAPGAAPILGGYVHLAFGWQANFVLVALIGVVAAALVWRWLPESTVPSPGAANPARMVRDYARLGSEPRFMHHALTLGCGMGVIYAFVTVAPFLLIDRYGVAIEHFGYYQATIVAGYVVGSLLTDRAARRMGTGPVLSIGVGCCVAGTLGLALMLLPGLEGTVALTVSMTLVALGLGPIFAIAPAEALEIAPSRAGAAAAAIGAMEMTLGGVASAAVVALHDGTARPLPIVAAGLLAIGFAGWLWGGRGRGPRADGRDSCAGGVG